MDAKLGLTEIAESDFMLRAQLEFERSVEQFDGSNLYRFLAGKLPAETEILALLDGATPDQPLPVFLFATVNYLLGQNRADPLARFYPNYRTEPEAPSAALVEDFRAFCLKHRDDLQFNLQTRAVQTSEVRRCALLYPALCLASRFSTLPVYLMDVGAAAGFNLLLDQYEYSYSDGTRAGKTGSGLHLHCELENTSLPEMVLPPISKRVGIDVNPIDLSLHDELAWMRALIWPDQPERMALFDQAVAIRKQHKLEIYKASGADMPKLMASRMPPDLHLLVQHSFTLNQFTVNMREEFMSNLADISKKRPVSCVGIEWLSGPAPDIRLTHFSAGRPVLERQLAECHPHGAWIKNGDFTSTLA